MPQESPRAEYSESGLPCPSESGKTIMSPLIGGQGLVFAQYREPFYKTELAQFAGIRRNKHEPRGGAAIPEQAQRDNHLLGNKYLELLVCAYRRVERNFSII